MFDTMSRRYLSTYGSKWVKTPNFERLKKRTLQFDNFFSGSLPCMPARRELHTGRYNFLHRSWGPIEPFDISVMEILKKQGVYTHIVTDHSHYWEDGGATYLTRYTTWEGFRGQEGDRFVGIVDKEQIIIPRQITSNKKSESLHFNWANRSKVCNEAEYSSVQTIEAGLNFIDDNHNSEPWFLQIECFDPHEPFDVPQRFLNMYDDTYVGDNFDWPSYEPVCESEEEQLHIKKRYAALISMCDFYLGKILDKMDEHAMWEDTMLIVNTDHGFLMGEHEWFGKNVQPCYNEVCHIPFYLYDPRYPIKNENRKSLGQMIDIGPTLLDYFGIDKPAEMIGKSLFPIIENDIPVREGILFGSFGGAINVSDGNYTYMRASVDLNNEPLYEYTLIPTKMRGFIPRNLLKESTLTNEFSFLNGVPVLKIPGEGFGSSYKFGNKLFSQEVDYEQLYPIDDPILELKMIELMRQLMIENESPREQYQRIGIPRSNEMDFERLLNQKKNQMGHQHLNLEFNITQKQKMKIMFIKDFIPNHGIYDIEKMLNFKFSISHQKDIDDVIIQVATSLLDRSNINTKEHEKILKRLHYSGMRG
ncbi:MAG: sulfatase [Culicoidibacterales bacterium]